MSHRLPSLHALADKLRTVLLDLRYGALLHGVEPTPYAHLGAHAVASSDYRSLSHMFRDRIAPSDVLVDVGCGRGRVINWWLSQGLRNRMIGIELNESIAQETRSRLRRHGNVTILTGDAIERLPEDGTIFYLFNPFDADVMRRFKCRLNGIASASGRTITVVYYNSKHGEVFQSDPTCKIEHGDALHPYAIISIRPGPLGTPPLPS